MTISIVRIYISLMLIFSKAKGDRNHFNIVRIIEYNFISFFNCNIYLLMLDYIEYTNITSFSVPSVNDYN